MTDFSYIAVDKLEKIKRGVISSLSPSQVRKDLTAKNLELISCEEIEENISWHNLDIGDLFKLIFYNKITPLEKISFTHHLAVMLKAGVPIIEAIESLGGETVSPKFKKIIKQLINELKKGKTLSSVLGKEEFLTSSHLAVLKSGEASGKVTESLLIINNDLKRDYRIKKKVKSAMAYPAIITLTLIGVSGFIILFVLPKIGEVFKQMSLTIPLPTRVLLALGSFLNRYYLELIVVSIATAGFLFFINRATGGLGLKFLSQLVFFIPVIKKIAYQIGMARFTRSLSSLFASGVPIAESLTISSKTFGRRRYQKIVEEIGEKVKKGVSLASAFQDYKKTFGEMLIKMCSVGEKSGKLADILKELALFYEEEAEASLENFSTIIEPILMLLVGLGVGGMVLSIIGPIYQMIGSLTP